MLGSIDCMHWKWIKRPKSLHGQFKRRDKKYSTIMLDAVANQQLWFWHAYFGVPGANNDLNVLYGSPLFDDLLLDKVLEAPFVVNGKTYVKGYYLAGGIYPQLSTFVKVFTIARDQKTMKFKRVQESARKDIEKAFGVLQDKTNQEMTLLCDINPMIDEVRVLVRCISIRNSHPPGKPDIKWGLEMVLQDQQDPDIGLGTLVLGIMEANVIGTILLIFDLIPFSGGMGEEKRRRTIVLKNVELKGQILQWYKVSVRVIDDTDSASLLLYEDMFLKLINIPCYKMIEQYK
ncbi:zinc finger, CCHC-type containing protein [Tanacetum coccineum]|uniref:Zinc finger, CCHC-type containing protein n=1 Tax=Tanacetum coccineum TaxID=301880 RepID=A0ABQ5HXX6_9ASTR